MVTDSSLNIYITNYSNGTIVKITAGGVMSTLGTIGGQPLCITRDSSGNLYIGNGSINIFIMRISDGASGIYSTGAGGGPDGIAVDPSGNVFSVRTTSNTVFKSTKTIGNNVLSINDIGKVITNDNLYTDATGIVRVPLQTNTMIDNYLDTVVTRDYLYYKNYAVINSPIFTGTPTLPTGTIATTQTIGDNTTKLATTAFVKGSLNSTGVTINGTLVPLGGTISFTTSPQTTISAPLAIPYVDSSATRTTVTGWTFNVTAGKVYKVEIIGTYQTAATTTGGSIGFILSSGTGTIHGIMNGEIVQTTVATGVRTTIRAINATNTTAGSFMTTPGVGVINSPHYIGGILNFNCVTSGVFEIQFATEVAASSAQLNAGSLMLVTEY
jgi:hypothetical protein